MNAILVVWLQMYIAVALNLWGDAVENMVFWLLKNLQL